VVITARATEEKKGTKIVIMNTNLRLNCGHFLSLLLVKALALFIKNRQVIKFYYKFNFSIRPHKGAQREIQRR